MVAKQEVTNGWHVSKTVNIGHLVTTGVAIIGGFAYLHTQVSRIDVLEIQQQQINDRIVRVLEQQERYDGIQDNSLLEFRGEMREAVRDITIKLDRLIERNGNGN